MKLNQPRILREGIGGQVPVLDKAPREGTLLDAIGQLESALSSHDNLVSDLCRQLAPILANDPSTDGDVAPSPYPAQTPDLNRLYSIINQIHTQSSHIGIILNRLQIR